MKHRIDPTVDCVFKAILGSEEHKNLLLHFLNHIVKPEVPLEQVEILNPYNEKEFVSDKLTVVDVKARDATGTVYQIEIQLAIHPFLPERILYTWSDLYQSQLESGNSFKKLRPVISIWILTKSLISDSPAYHHHFQLYDAKNKKHLTDQCSIHILELNKWSMQQQEAPLLSSEDLWYYFFREAKRWEELPSIANTLEMRQAMSVLQQFSERQQDYFQYQARQNFIREQVTIQEAFQETQEALQGAQEELQGTQEELQGTQEELQGTQEELQGTQEELQGTQEELQGTQEAFQETQEAFQETQEALQGSQEALQGSQEALQGAQEELQNTREREEKVLQKNKKLLDLLKKAGIKTE